MKMEREILKVEELVDAFASGKLIPCPKKPVNKRVLMRTVHAWKLDTEKEHNQVRAFFQRAVAWSDAQMRLFIDSVLRGYQVPLIYLRKLPDSQGYEIIDGQQRINALYGFMTGERVIERHEITKAADSAGVNVRYDHISPLFNPEKSREFPDWMRKEECPWAGTVFNDPNPKKRLPEKYQKQFRETKITVSIMTEASDDEAAALFTRLQGGSALTTMEKLDALPGQFCGYVRQVGGKFPTEWPKHPFVEKFVPTPRTDRGQVRQLVAQTFALFLSRRSFLEKGIGEKPFCSVGGAALDECYRAHTLIEADTVERFVQILNNLYELLADRDDNRKLDNPNFMHLVLLADMLADCSPQWGRGIVGALKDWDEMLRDAEQHKKDNGAAAPTDNLILATLFGNYRKPSATHISNRHAIYARQMLILLLAKDPQLNVQLRAFIEKGWTDALREAAYYLENRQCCHCDKKSIEFTSAHFQQMPGHAQGMFYENWALVCKNCNDIAPTSA